MNIMKNIKKPLRRFHEEITRNEYFFSMNFSQTNPVFTVVRQNTFVLNSTPMMQRYAKYLNESEQAMRAAKRYFT
tara:strand:+ start:17 stop:241 length:225 start_codon:yes stop_codon:yes gene_type:complete